MSEIEARPAEELVVPALGIVVDLSDPVQCGRTLADVRQIEWKLRDVKRALTEALVAESERLGLKTLHLEGMTVTVKGGSEVVYDAEEIENGLRASGMPEERIREIVVETVSYKIAAVEAKRAAGANPVYAKVIDENKTVVEQTPSVSVSRRA